VTQFFLAFPFCEAVSSSVDNTLFFLLIVLLVFSRYRLSFLSPALDFCFFFSLECLL